MVFRMLAFAHREKLMKIMTLVLTLLISSFAFASSIEETVERIEREREVSCTFSNASVSFCVGNPNDGSQVCNRTVRYKCLPDDVSKKEFRLKLRVRKVGFQAERVRKIVYIY